MFYDGGDKERAGDVKRGYTSDNRAYDFVNTHKILFEIHTHSAWKRI